MKQNGDAASIASSPCDPATRAATASAYGANVREVEPLDARASALEGSRRGSAGFCCRMSTGSCSYVAELCIPMINAKQEARQDARGSQFYG